MFVERTLHNVIYDQNMSRTCSARNRKLMCYSSRIIPANMMPALFTMSCKISFWLARSPDLSIIEHILGMMRQGLDDWVSPLLFNCIGMFKRRRMIYHRMVFNSFRVLCMHVLWMLYTVLNCLHNVYTHIILELRHVLGYIHCVTNY